MCKLYVRYCRRKFSEVKLPTIWTDEKQRDVKSKRREEKRREEKRREKIREAKS